jgi:hypothetical protein
MASGKLIGFVLYAGCGYWFGGGGYTYPGCGACSGGLGEYEPCCGENPETVVLERCLSWSCVMYWLGGDGMLRSCCSWFCCCWAAIVEVTVLCIISFSRSLRDLRRRWKQKPRNSTMIKDPAPVPAPMPACAPLLRDELPVAEGGLGDASASEGRGSEPEPEPEPAGGLPVVGAAFCVTRTVVGALGTNVNVVVAITVRRALITEVTVCQIVVEAVTVARAEAVTVNTRFEVLGIVTTLTVCVTVVSTRF